MANKIQFLTISWSLILFVLQPGFSQHAIKAEVSVSIVSDSGSRHYLAPGEPASLRGESLAVSILPETDCYLYAIFTPAEGSPPIMLWPSPALRAVECLPQNRITELVYDSAAAQVSFTEGTLTVLLLTTFPADLHTALTGKKSDQGRILREIRTLFQRHSAYAEKKETGMVLIAGNVRTEHSPPQGIQVDREKFWGGVYEWTVPGE
ncbi:MAG: hypothetical protein EWM51_04295 [Treponema sp.]|nr:MAG: hypothetical protein EWM51_04295 [Treponema sp.]